MLHEATSSPGPGRRHAHVQVLNKSAIVLTVACWESYIEGLAIQAFDFLLKSARNPSTFPDKVLTVASRDLRSDHDARKIWVLAGDGWRAILEGHKAAVLKEFVGGLNTPRPKQVDAMFECLLGMHSLSTLWRWRGMPNNRAKDQLEDLITLRGEIAHNVRTSRYVQKVRVERAITLVQNLAVVSSNRVRSYVSERTGATPWVSMTFRRTG